MSIEPLPPGESVPEEPKISLAIQEDQEEQRPALEIEAHIAEPLVPEAPAIP
jgi:hypothetical protein